MQKRLRAIAAELKTHAPFTLFGAATGVICMLLFRNAGQELNHRLFLVFHPAHVVLSAIVTASLFKLYEKKAGILKIVVIGYIGAIGVATLSDCVLPFFGEDLLGVAIPVHSHGHEGEHGDEHDHEGEHLEEAVHDHSEAPGEHEHAEAVEPEGTDEAHDHDHAAAESSDQGTLGSVRRRLHLGFIEDWYLVNPAAILGILIAYFWPKTHFPHAGHVLISTWASSFHVLMNTHKELSGGLLLGAFVVLFIAVWLPCCISDIVFPMLFVKSAPPHAHGHCHHKPTKETSS